MDMYTALVQSEALAAATAKILVEIRTPATVRARVRGFGVSFDGVTASNTPATVELVSTDTDGSGESSVTPRALDQEAPASLVTAHYDFSSDPTVTGRFFTHRVTPNGGLLIHQFTVEEAIVMPVSTRLGIQVTAAQIVNADAWILFEH